MTALIEFVRKHTERGECQCGQCIDKGDKPEPDGHTIDLVFFKVAKRGKPTADDFRLATQKHSGEFGECDPFDGSEHGYIELGGWIGDQGLAMQYMALGVLLGAFRLLSPRTVLGADVPNELALQLAGNGYLSIVAAAKRSPVEVA